MGWLKAILTVLGVIDRATDGKRIVVGKGDKVLIDVDKLPPGDPGHDVDPAVVAVQPRLREQHAGRHTETPDARTAVPTR